MEHTMNVPVTGPAEALFDLKFHQVAIYISPTLMDFALSQWALMGYTNWHHDTALLKGHDDGIEVVKSARMAFNYDILPMEFEYVTYHGARNRHDSRDGGQPFISHLSTMVEDVDAMCRLMAEEYAMVPYHTFTTSEHTNPNVKFRKRFKEAIFNTNALFGYDIKLIQRIPW